MVRDSSDFKFEKMLNKKCTKKTSYYKYKTKDIT